MPKRSRSSATSCTCTCIPSPAARVLLASLTCAFASGGVGGVVHFVAAWLIHIAKLQALEKLEPDTTVEGLYRSVVLGGLWGFLFIFRVGNVRHLGLQALAYSLVPTALQLLYIYPHFTSYGYLGLGLSPLVPVYELVINYAGWALPALAWFSMLGYEDAEDAEESWQQNTYSRPSILSQGGPSLSNPMLV